MKKHFNSLFSRPPKKAEKRMLITAGWCLVMTSVLVIVVVSKFPYLAFVWWLAFLSFGIFLIALSHSK